MSINTIETHGDISGGWIGYEFPEGSQILSSEATSDVAYDDRGVDLGTKNAGISAFLDQSNIPPLRERVECLDLANCFGACDGHIEAEEEDVRPVSGGNTVAYIGQLALF